MTIYITADEYFVMRNNEEIIETWAKSNYNCSAEDAIAMYFNDFLDEHYNASEIFDMDDCDRIDVKKRFLFCVKEEIKNWLDCDCIAVVVSPEHGCNLDNLDLCNLL